MLGVGRTTGAPVTIGGTHGGSMNAGSRMTHRSCGPRQHKKLQSAELMSRSRGRQACHGLQSAVLDNQLRN